MFVFELVVKNTKKIEKLDVQSRVAWRERQTTTAAAEAFGLDFDSTLDHIRYVWVCIYCISFRYWVTIVARFDRTYSMGFVEWTWEDECVGRFLPSSSSLSLSLFLFVMFVCRFVYGPCLRLILSKRCFLFGIDVLPFGYEWSCSQYTLHNIYLNYVGILWKIDPNFKFSHRIS